MNYKNIGCVSCNRDLPIKMSLSLKMYKEERIIFISFHDSMRLYNLIFLVKKYSLDTLLVQKEHFLIISTIKDLNIILIERSDYRENLNLKIDYYSNCAISSLMNFLKLSDILIIQKYLENKCILQNECKDNIYDQINFTNTKYGQRKLKLDLIHPLLEVKDIKERHKKLHLFRNNGLMSLALEKQLRAMPDIEKFINFGTINNSDLKSSKKIILEAVKIYNFLYTYKNLKEQSELFQYNIEPLIKIFQNLFNLKLSDKTQLHEIFNQKNNDYLNLAIKIYKESIENTEEYLKNLTTQLDFNVTKSFNNTVSLKIKKHVTDYDFKKSTNITAEVQMESLFQNFPNVYNEKTKSSFEDSSDLLLKNSQNNDGFPSWLIILAIKNDYLLATTLELQNFNYKVQESYNQILEIGGEFCKKTLLDCKSKKDFFNNLFEEISELDVCLSIYKFSIKFDCCIPNIEDNICVVSSYHPLINKDKIVYNDIYMCDLIRFNILTGPNMSGKSAYMKQLLYHCILFQVGYPVTAKNASLKIFKRIIYKTNNFTTPLEMFTCIDILEMNPDTLFLIDELGRGVSCQNLLPYYLTISNILIKDKVFCILITHHIDFIQYIKNENGINKLKSNKFKVSFGLHKNSLYLEELLKNVLNITFEHKEIEKKDNNSSTIIKLALKVQQCKTEDDEFKIIKEIKNIYLSRH